MAISSAKPAIFPSNGRGISQQLPVTSYQLPGAHLPAVVFQKLLFLLPNIYLFVSVKSGDKESLLTSIEPGTIYLPSGGSFEWGNWSLVTVLTNQDLGIV